MDYESNTLPLSDVGPDDKLKVAQSEVVVSDRLQNTSTFSFSHIVFIRLLLQGC